MYISKEKRNELKESLNQLNESRCLMEGSWKLPFDIESATKLKKFMEKAQPKETAKDNLYYIFGDDELFDNIEDSIDPNDVRYEVKVRLRELLHAYDNNEIKYDGTIDQETRKILNSILEVQLNEEVLKSRDGCPIKVGNRVIVINGPEAYVNCEGVVDWVGNDQCVVIFDDAKPVKQNLMDCNQLSVVKTNELDESSLMETSEEDDITVEVDGEVVVDTAEEEEEEQKDALDGYGSKLAITDMLLRAVSDENETIQFYNNLIATCEEEGFSEIANVIRHISEEENIHVGMLQHAMATISDQAKTIKDGEEEAAQILNGEEDLTPEDTAIEG